MAKVNMAYAYIHAIDSFQRRIQMKAVLEKILLSKRRSGGVRGKESVANKVICIARQKRVNQAREIFF